MHLKSIELVGFKSFARKSAFEFSTAVTAIVGPNGSGKSNVAEAFRFVLGEQSMKSLRGKRGEDLIFSGTTATARANRASVKITFDNPQRNGKRALDIDFDEVVVERVVHRDGINEYLINGSKVRLRDVIELLAGVNIGASGHHIISQGEADRILLANSSDRREMIEDALGLKVFQYKKQESIKKLERTEENKRQVESLRKENAPHLKFLSRQVEKIKKAMSLRDDLLVRYKDYLKRESLYLESARKQIKEEEEGPKRELRDLEDTIQTLRRTIEKTEPDGEGQELLTIEKELSVVRKEQEQITLDLGRIEGQILFEERGVERAKHDDKKLVPLTDVESLTRSVEAELDKAERDLLDRDALSKIILGIRSLIQGFIHTHREEVAYQEHNIEMLEKLKKQEKELLEQKAAAQKQEQKLERAYQELRARIDTQKDEGREAEREMFEVMSRQNELRAQLNDIRYRSETIARDEMRFKQEITEATVLVGQGILEYELIPVNISEALSEDRSGQEKRKRELEKMKIRLEELGGGSADEIMQEYEEVQRRDEFLEKEIEDLKGSIESLQRLIKDLDNELDTRFKEGIQKINIEFDKFFRIMFDGGSAELDVVKEKPKRRMRDELLMGDLPDDEMSGEEDDDAREGIDISVTLPKKRIKGLVMLSGGERALTSIALIFAMSQVNPPPFLILDETDAALDEANSRRYGDMIENLAKKSQLILITHNRETMSRAGILYGVTMGADGVSKMLSVRFEEAVQVAK